MSPNLSPDIREKVDVPLPEIGQPIERVDTQQEIKVEKRVEAKPVSRNERDERYASMTAPIPQTHIKQQEGLGEKSESLLAVEAILEDHVAPLFERLPEKDQVAFKAKGEDTARAIDDVLHQTKIKAKKILDLIMSWLLFIPGINKFFVEQQAEIKTNKLLALREREQQ